MDKDFLLVEPPSDSPFSISATLDPAVAQPKLLTENMSPQAPPELDNRPSSPIRLQRPDEITLQQSARSTHSDSCEVDKSVNGNGKGSQAVLTTKRQCFHKMEAETQLSSGLSMEGFKGSLKNPSALLLPPVATPPAESYPPPPPPPPPPVQGAPPTRQRVLPKRPILDVVESAQQLRPTGTPPIERIADLLVGGVHQRVALTHHPATPFDLNNYLWLLKYGKVNCWYALPSQEDFKRFEKLESVGLVDEIPGYLTKSDTPSVPAPTNTLSIWVGEVMGVFSKQYDTRAPANKAPADPHRHVDWPFCEADGHKMLNEAMLTFYIVSERAEAKSLEESGHEFRTSGLYPPPPPPPPFGVIPQQVGKEKVFKIEKVGSMEACLARVYHNAALHGLSTVFTCVVRGDPDLKEARPGLDGFQRVPNLVSLLQAEEEEGKVNVFF